MLSCPTAGNSVGISLFPEQYDIDGLITVGMVK